MSSGQHLKSFKQSYMSFSKSSAGRCDGKYNYVYILTFEIALHGTSLFTGFQSKQLCWVTSAHIIINKIDSHRCPKGHAGRQSIKRLYLYGVQWMVFRIEVRK